MADLDVPPIRPTYSCVHRYSCHSKLIVQFQYMINIFNRKAANIHFQALRIYLTCSMLLRLPQTFRRDSSPSYVLPKSMASSPASCKQIILKTWEAFLCECFLVNEFIGCPWNLKQSFFPRHILKTNGEGITFLHNNKASYWS